jgi:hypothetical protein
MAEPRRAARACRGADPGIAAPVTGSDSLRSIRSIDDLVELVEAEPQVYLRFSSREPGADGPSIDAESGLEMPGVCVNPLTPEPWWTRPLGDWLARQVCNYVHLKEHEDRRRAWVLRGQVVGRGPDNEPLLEHAEPVALLDDELLEQAKQRYHEVFDVGRLRAER